MKRTKALIFVGPSASGKTTIMIEYVRSHPEAYIVPSVTTRRPRDGDVDYIYVTEAVFQNMVDNGLMLEHSIYAGNCYGTLKTSFEAPAVGGVGLDKTALKAMNLAGALNVAKAMGSGVALVYVCRPIRAALDALYGRESSGENVAERARTMRNEQLLAMDECCYRIDNSGTVDDAIRQAEQIVALLEGSQNHLDNLRLLTVEMDDWTIDNGKVTLYFKVPKVVIQDTNPDAVQGTLSVTFPRFEPEPCECEARLAPAYESGNILVEGEWRDVQINDDNLEYLLSFYLDDEDGDDDRR